MLEVVSHEGFGLTYFRYSNEYHKFVILRALEELGQIELPLSSENEELLNSLSAVPFQSCIEAGWIEKVSESANVFLRLTSLGTKHLRRHYIDFQNDLFQLQGSLGAFFQDRIATVVEQDVKSLAVYGASDTARSLLGYLTDRGIEILCVVDDDVDKQGGTFLGLPVVGADKMCEYPVDAILVASVEYESQIKMKIEDSFGQKYRVLTLFGA